MTLKIDLKVSHQRQRYQRHRQNLQPNISPRQTRH